MVREKRIFNANCMPVEFLCRGVRGKMFHGGAFYLLCCFCEFVGHEVLRLLCGGNLCSPTGEPFE